MPPESISYAFDDDPGLSRRRAGRGFSYSDASGRAVDAATRRRIQKLVIPPAWTDVWICPDPNGHIQATGRDAKGRKQYIYHPEWRQWREETKFQRILDFAAALPRLREAVARDLARRKLSRSLVLATAVRVLDLTLMRVGNDEYARQNQSYGLATLLTEHIECNGKRVRFAFRGKSGKTFEAELHDRRVTSVLRRLEGLPGQHLFQFIDEHGEPCRITSDDINAYIREASGGDFTAKDFRTWAASVFAVLLVLQQQPATSEAAAKRATAQAVKAVARRLGNTPAVCRRSYIHPDVLESYRDGSLASLAAKIEDIDDGDTAGLFTNEKIVLGFLKRRARQRLATDKDAATPSLTEAMRLSVEANAA